ncbi:hypothetical protein JQN64_27145, partial [Escherichia coli]|nr:hypothetical protein [Escherichia coli]
ADEIFIANNGYIDDISMQLGNVSTSLTLADNNEAVKVQLPNLIWASNLTFRFCASVSVPSLETLNGSLGLYNNGFETFAAPNLTSVGEAVAIVANEKLNNISFPLLTQVKGNIQIANNPVSCLTSPSRTPRRFSIASDTESALESKLKHDIKAHPGVQHWVMPSDVNGLKFASPRASPRARAIDPADALGLATDATLFEEPVLYSLDRIKEDANNPGYFPYEDLQKSPSIKSDSDETVQVHKR